MTDALTAAEYREERDRVARSLAAESGAAVDEGLYDEYHQAVFELAVEDAEFHEWFARTQDGALYGAIVQHADANVEDYTDWESAVLGGGPEDVLRCLAYVSFEADLIDRALGWEDGDAPE